jgi:hypothetical protein
MSAPALDQDLDRIATAVRECIAQCMPSKNPTVAISIYLKALRTEGWTEVEVALVRSTVARLLIQIAREVIAD